MIKQSGEICLTLAVHHIDMLTRIFEGYDHLGVVTTMDRKAGLVVIRGTADTMPDIIGILDRLPFECQMVSPPGV